MTDKGGDVSKTRHAASRVPSLVLVASLIAVAACSTKQVLYVPMSTLPADPGPIAASLFLVGDAGEANAYRDAVLAHLTDEVASVTEGGGEVVVAYLGDNIYESGAREAFAEEDLLLLDAQIQPLGRHEDVRGVFVPGNHDWSKGATTGVARAAVQRQEEWLTRLADGRDVALRPGDGCPGPATLDVGTSVHLVFIDSEWLLREPRDDCGGADAFYERLARDLERHADKTVIAIAHHPLVSGGLHGGYVAPFYRGPLVYYLATKSGVSMQDLSSGRYTDMIDRLRDAFASSGRPPLVFAAGHDHNLQVIRADAPGLPTYQLVSGAGSRSSNARRVTGTRYATNKNGYMRLDFGTFGVRLVVYSLVGDPAGVRPVFSCMLRTPEGDAPCPEADLVGPGR